MNNKDIDIDIPDDFDEVIWESLVEVTNIFGRECTKVISQPRLWSGFVGNRDIVDTGQLRASQKVDYEKSNLATEVSYNTEYASAVHNGATIKYSNGNVRKIPARPWMDIAASTMRLNDRLEEELVNKIQRKI